MRLSVKMTFILAIALASLPWASAQKSGIVTPPNTSGEKLPGHNSRVLERVSAWKAGNMGKLSPELVALFEQKTQKGKSGQLPGSANFEGYTPVMPQGGSRVVIHVMAAEDTSALLTALEKMGMEHAARAGNLISGTFPIAKLPELAGHPLLKQAQAIAAGRRSGAVTSRGDIALDSDDVRAQLGYDGTGVTIGVLSDSYDCLNGAAADIASGDLPAGINVLQDFCPMPVTVIDEGRAMLQIVHDIAPGADLLFRTAFRGLPDFAQGIRDLAAAGADVIVDDIFYAIDPFYQDGAVAQAIEDVVANGVVFVTAAGNSGRNSYESRFVDSGVAGPIGGTFHDFDPGPGVDTSITLDVAVGRNLIALQWEDPFFSVSGAPGAQTNLDLLFTDLAGNIIFFSAANNVGGDPVEFINFNRSGSAAQAQLQIVNLNGPPPRNLKIVVFNNNNTRFVEYATNSSTVVGHANAESAISVGSTAWFNHPSLNPNNIPRPLINSGSSRGRTPILIDTNGNPTFRLRRKPDVVGPDGVNTTFFARDLGFAVSGTNEPDGFPNFFGTSAAAPHIAAVVALMLEANPNATPRQIDFHLWFTAQDMDDPETPFFDFGPDMASGFGFVNALEAVERAEFFNFGKKGGERLEKAFLQQMETELLNAANSGQAGAEDDR